MEIPRQNNYIPLEVVQISRPVWGIESLSHFFSISDEAYATTWPQQVRHNIIVTHTPIPQTLNQHTLATSRTDIVRGATDTFSRLLSQTT